MAVLSKPMAFLSSFINKGRFIKVKDQASGRNGRFIKQKRPNCQISKIRAADCRFHIAPYKEFISGQAEPFLSRAGKAIGRFIKAGQPQWPFYQRRRPFYQGRPASIAVLATVAAMAGVSPRSGHMARSLDLDCGWPISYCPVQAVYQRPSRAIFRKSWQSGRTASKASDKASYAASYSLKLLRKLLLKASYKEP